MGSGAGESGASGCRLRERIEAYASGSKRIGSGSRRGGSDIYRDIPEPLRALIEPVVDEHECELVDVEVTRPRGPGLLRVIVDSRAGDGRVPIERCAAISRGPSVPRDFAR